MKQKILLSVMMMTMVLVATSCSKDEDRDPFVNAFGPLDENLIGRWVQGHQLEDGSFYVSDEWNFWSNGMCDHTNQTGIGSATSIASWWTGEGVIYLDYSSKGVIQSTIYYKMKNGKLGMSSVRTTDDSMFEWYEKRAK